MTLMPVEANDVGKWLRVDPLGNANWTPKLKRSDIVFLFPSVSLYHSTANAQIGK